MSSDVRHQKFAKRKRVNQLALTLSLGAMVFGLVWLVWILWQTFWLGIDGLTWATLTEMTPAPNDPGGLANAIYGSFLMVMLATFVGTPIGIMVGTYQMETPAGEMFDVEIPAFSLDSPHQARQLH